MQFIHKFLTPITIERIDSDSGRLYQIDTGEQFRSVTSILQDYNKKGLELWRKSVGDYAADRISTQARIRGSAVHSICEKYLMNDETYRHKTMPFNLSEFNKIKPLLDTSVTEVYGIEHKMYSRRLRCAGTTDLICLWNGKPAIVDFKTSRYVKKEASIDHYFIQASVYSNMVKELYSIDCEDVVIVMTVDHEQPVVFSKKRDDYQDKIDSIFITES
jgi:ATP-dependent exoDNAse (exonuclease V) beta subunit